MDAQQKSETMGVNMTYQHVQTTGQNAEYTVEKCRWPSRTYHDYDGPDASRPAGDGNVRLHEWLQHETMPLQKE